MHKLQFTLKATDEYERLVKFCIENDLEFNDDEEVDTDIVKCWKMTDPDDNLVGACILAKRQDKFIIDGIAVTPLFRKNDLGKIMVKKLINEVKKLGGDEIYLVARAPKFFKTLGFETITPEESPVTFECHICPQFNKECFPETMRLEL